MRQFWAVIRLLLIVDEVQTRFCRTGKMFACNHFDVQPDIVCLAKGIAVGLPMLCGDKIEFPSGLPGSTFGCHLLVCDASLAVLDFMINYKLIQEAQKRGLFN